MRPAREAGLPPDSVRSGAAVDEVAGACVTGGRMRARAACARGKIAAPDASVASLRAPVDHVSLVKARFGQGISAMAALNPALALGMACIGF